MYIFNKKKLLIIIYYFSIKIFTEPKIKGIG